MITKEEAKKKIAGFLELYKKHLAEGRFEVQKEANTEKYIEVLLENLGWDRLTDLERQHNIKSGEVDYSVNLRGNSYFLMEVKKYKEELDKHRKQAIDYAFQSGQKWVVLTNLREIRVYNAQYRDQPEEIMRLFRPIKIEELLDRFEDLWALGQPGAEENLIEKRALDMSKVKIKEPITILSEALLDWRSLLTREMRAHPRLNEISGKDKETTDEWVDEAVQMLLNRFTFLRTIEDLGQWRFSIRTVLNEWRDKKKKPLMEHISDFFKEVDKQYNSGLFAKHPCEDLTLSDNILEQVIEELYINKENDLEWDFKALASDQDILGLAYEQYLGTTLTEKTSRIKQNKEKRKKMGIYYTPKYIVEYIVKNALGNKLKEAKKLEDILQIKVLDPACGSGSFLKEAYRLFKEEIKRRGWGNQRYFDKNGDQMSVFDAILKKCIYGVDLDKKACEMAKLNLLIMAAEGGTHQLPDIDQSIQQGNSLIDDPAIVGPKLAFKWEERFPDVFSDGGFEVVVGNPPYFGIRTLSSKTQNYFKYSNRWREQYTRQADVYYYFIIQAIKSLGLGGYMGFIVGRYWLEATDANILRKFISDNCTIERIVDFRDISIFQDASVHTSIIILKKIKDKKIRAKVSIMDSTKTNKVSLDLFNEKLYFEFNQSKLSSPRWIFMEGEGNDIFNKITQNGTKLSKCFHVGTGVQTGRDGIFVIDKLKASENNLEKSGLGYWIKNGQVRRYSLETPNLLVIKGRVDLNLRQFKKIMAYLGKNKLELTTRYEFKKGMCEWYQWSTVREVKLFDLDKKIICPYKSGSSNFALLQNTNTYFSKDIYQLIKLEKTTEEYEYFLGILNSKVIQYFFSNYGKKMGSITEFYAEAMLDIPLKQLDMQKIKDKETHDKIVKLVIKIILLNKQLQEIGDKKTHLTAKLEADIKKTDQEIDELVYKLYFGEHYEEEKKIIEESLR